MSRFQVMYSDEFKVKVFERAEELIQQGLTEGEVVLTEGRSGTLRIFIDRKPDLVLFSAQGVEGPMAGHTVYVGGSKPA